MKDKNQAPLNGLNMFRTWTFECTFTSPKLYAHSCTSQLELLTGKAELVKKIEKKGRKKIKKTQSHICIFLLMSS